MWVTAGWPELPATNREIRPTRAKGGAGVLEIRLDEFREALAFRAVRQTVETFPAAVAVPASQPVDGLPDDADRLRVPGADRLQIRPHKTLEGPQVHVLDAGQAAEVDLAMRCERLLERLSAGLGQGKNCQSSDDGNKHVDVGYRSLPGKANLPRPHGSAQNMAEQHDAAPRVMLIVVKVLG